MCKVAKSAENDLVILTQELRNADLNVKIALNADLSEHHAAGEALRHFLEADAATTEIKRKIRRLKLKKPPATK